MLASVSAPPHDATRPQVSGRFCSGPAACKAGTIWAWNERYRNLEMDTVTRIRGLLLRGGLVIAALVALTLTINLSWFDEPLQSELERLKTLQTVSMEDNAYPLIYGLSAADDRDPHATGLAIVETLVERYREGQMTLSDDELNLMLGGSGLDDAWRASLSSLSCNS